MTESERAKAKHLLLVDDDSEAVLSLSRALKAASLPFPLHIATAPGQALELAAQFNPHVIVMDLCLNETQGPQSGFALLRQLLLDLIK